MALKTFLSGEVLRASDVNRYLVNTRFAKKAASEAVTGAVFQDDDHLSLSVEASATYLLTGLLVCTGLTGTFNFQFSVPSGTTVVGGLIAYYTSSSASYTDAFSASGPGAAAVQKFNSSTQKTPVPLQALVFVGSTAGSLTLQWCGQSGDPDAVTLTTDSYLCLRQID